MKMMRTGPPTRISLLLWSRREHKRDPNLHLVLRELFQILQWLKVLKSQPWLYRNIYQVRRRLPRFSPRKSLLKILQIRGVRL